MPHFCYFFPPCFCCLALVMNESFFTSSKNFQRIYSYSSTSDQSDEYPLTKSLGFSIKDGLGKTLEDSRLSQEFMEKYQEMEKASMESFENFEKSDEKRHRRVVGDEELDLIKEEIVRNRRRGSNRLQSAIGRRRARSQAHRRDKLNNQSMRSHMQHSKQNNLEYND